MDVSTSANDWRSDCNGIVSLLSKARREKRFSDVQFVLGRNNKTKKVFHVHKIILACGSPVFETMFFGPMAEKKDVLKTDDDPEAFDYLLNHFYGKRNKISSLLSVWKFHLIGDKYLVPNILDIAKQCLEQITITENDFWDVVESDVFTHPLFFDKLYSYLNGNAENVVKSEKFLKAPENFLDALLQMDRLNLNEEELLLAVTKWGYQNLKQVNSENMKKFLKNIRFSCLSCDQYFKFIDKYPEVIDSKSSLQILQYLYSVFGRRLPSWCNTNQMSRRYAL